MPLKLVELGEAPARTLGAPCSACEIRDVGIICGSLTAAELGGLRRIVSTVQCAAGQAVIHEGDPAEALFNVVAGAVKSYKLLPDGRRQITGFLFPGDFLGIALNDTYAYTAEALQATRLCRFPRRRLEALLAEFPNLGQRLLVEASNELVAAQDQMLLLGRKTAKERLASFLLALSERAARLGRPDSPVELSMSRGDIADYLGLTTETISRTLTQLRRSGVIRPAERGEIEIVQRAALRALTEGG